MKNLLLQGMIQKIVFALLFITGALLYAQNKTYASNQNSQITGVCLLCSVQNPQNAVGSNENDFATINIPISALGAKVEQTLIFPEITKKHFKKVVIGIGSPSHILSVQLLGEAYVESYSGTIANGDKTKINNNMLELAQDQKKGTIEFTPAKFFDRIKITLNGGALGLSDTLEIYYAYHTPDKFTNCGNPPLDPKHYYPFNGNGKDIISDFDLSSSNIDFNQNDLVCDGAVYCYYDDSGMSTNSSKETDPLNKNSQTISFWVKTDNQPTPADPKPYFEIINPIINISNRYKLSKTIDVKTTPGGGVPILHGTICPYSYEELIHIAIVYNKETNVFCFYKNGNKTNCIHGLPDIFQRIVISLYKTKMDELLIYDRALTDDEVKALVCSYGKIPNCTSGTSAPASKIAAPMDTFTVSPNPTTGEITLDGNILLVGSDISIRNTSGTEVYRSAFRSKTFELPATLLGGVYILTLQTKDKKVYTRKIILTR